MGRKGKTISFDREPLTVYMILGGERAGVAQLVEHQPSKLRVAGSIPVSRSNNFDETRLLTSESPDPAGLPNPIGSVFFSDWPT